MKQFLVALYAVMFLIMHTNCYADSSCDDWVGKDGYCVDYIKLKIPAFTIPRSTAEIEIQKNKGITEVTTGDVAIFKISNYWHVAYVERVHVNQQGAAVAIDVSEMNFGGQLSLDEYQSRWGIGSEHEWKRSLSCGITENYGLVSLRENIPLNAVTQVWSPDTASSDDRKLGEVVADKVREVINRYFLLAGRYL